MAALLVAMTIMAIMMTVAMPVWKQIAQREKEEELVFRGQQYARAIGLFQRKFANAAPPSFDVLLDQRFLRKKYKDPITNDDFVAVMQSQNAPGTTPAGGRGAAAPGGRPLGAGPTPAITPTTQPRPQPGSQSVGIIGVTSKSKDKSIRLYKGRSHYNEWQFVYTAPAGAPGAGGGGGGAPGQRGQGQRPGGPGQQAPSTPFGQPPFGGPNPSGRGGRGPGGVTPVIPQTPGRRGG